MHTLQYSNTYQVLLAAGCENHIDVLEIDPEYLDTSLKGKMIGHESMVVTFVAIERTPMVVSCDDKQRVKIWDIRNFKCIQTMDMHGKSPITKLVNMIEVGKLGILGARLEVMEFDEVAENPTLEGHSLHPIKVDFEPMTNELLVFTGQDVRSYDVRSGTAKHVFAGLVSPTDEASSFRYIHSRRAFLIGTQNGRLGLFSQVSGHRVSELCGHSADIPEIIFDSVNNMFVSASADSSVIIQREGKSGLFERIRTLRDNFGRKEIHLIELSLYDGILVLGNYRESSLYFWDYVFAKLLGEVKLPQGI